MNQPYEDLEGRKGIENSPSVKVFDDTSGADLACLISQISSGKK